MPETNRSLPCPYLGRADDPETIYLQPHAAHRCHTTRPAGRIEPVDQAGLCFGDFRACPRFVPLVNGRRAEPVLLVASEELAAEDDEAAAVAAAPAAGGGFALPARLKRLSFEEWIVYTVTAALVLVIGYVAFLSPARGGGLAPPTPDAGIQERALALMATETHTPTPAPSATPRPTRPLDVSPRETAPVPTPPPGGLVAAISPSERGVGSFNNADRLPAFGDRSLFVGRYEGKEYLGGLLFPLNRIPAGSRIASVQLELAGLTDDQLNGDGAWTVELLDPEVAKEWGNLTFETLAKAPATQLKTSWTVPAGDLAPRKINVLPFTDDARDLMMQRLKEGRVAFRIRGPAGAGDNLFAWDTGYGEGFGTRPVLRASFVPPPPTPGPKPGQPTALPLIVWISEPTPAPTATPLPGGMPKLLDRMILFISDRFGGSSLMVYDPAGNRFGQVTQPWVYVVGEARDAKVGETQVRVQEVPCGGAVPEEDEDFIPNAPTAVPDPARRCNQLLVKTPNTDWREITDPGYSHYDPAISPDGQWIAYVSTITGNDEVFKIKVDGTENTRLTENDWAWDKHPSWSPDGAQLVFWSNRDGRKQVYLMNADGSDQRNLSNNRFNDWDPVWAK